MKCGDNAFHRLVAAKTVRQNQGSRAVTLDMYIVTLLYSHTYPDFGRHCADKTNQSMLPESIVDCRSTACSAC